jgi:superfamily II DNA or RNA helicase
MRIIAPTTPIAQPGDLIHARGREWVVHAIPNEGQLELRPLTGSDKQTVVLDQRLERTPIKPARFELPAEANMATQWQASLLADALRFTLRRGAGPFRAAAQINFVPRTYQLVPLLMALRQEVPRLLIADDVGIGKTLEAGIILREFMDRGEVDQCSILCPPHLVEQWVDELHDRLGIQAVAVTSSSAKKLERGLQAGKSPFSVHPFTVVSLDYIKSDSRRATFVRTCPDFIIVDEAHTCVGTGNRRGVQKRYEVLRELAADAERRMLLLTATPHSGDQEAFQRLLVLLNPAFAKLQLDDQRFRESLSKHFVQRRRIDLDNIGYGDGSEGSTEKSPFSKHLEDQHPEYKLSPIHKAFHEAVLDYCFERIVQVGEDTRKRRLALWGTLAIMRCVGSSPMAALSALRNRALNEEDSHTSSYVAARNDELVEQVFDEDGDDEDAVDLTPATQLPETSALRNLLEQAEALTEVKDPKLATLTAKLHELLELDHNPVVFCRFLATANYVGEHIQKEFCRKANKKKYGPIHVEIVTGRQTPDERRSRVEKMGGIDSKADELPRRILIATDCLSEGINLQQLFDAVVHYDLSWNPTRHQQREGRVNRFGQASPTVRSVMMYSPDSAIDGAVLDVIIRKAEAIQKATGVTVPLPDADRASLTDALMAAVVLRRGKAMQTQLDFGPFDPTGGREALKAADKLWRDVEEGERRSTSIFAQNAMHPEVIEDEWQQTQDLLGSPQDAKEFVALAMARFGVPLDERRGIYTAHLSALSHGLYDRAKDKNLAANERFVAEGSPPPRASLLTRAHPLTSVLADSLLEAALEPSKLPDLSIGRTGAWPTPAVDTLTHVLVLRLRFKLQVRSKKAKMLMAEEAVVMAIHADGTHTTGRTAREMLATASAHNLADNARDRFVRGARERLAAYQAGPVATFAQQRAAQLAEDHLNVRRTSSRGNVGASVDVLPVLPPDVIGLYTLIPAQ